METRNIAIMLTDIKGFTSKTAGYSRVQTQELLAKHRELVLPVIEKYHGRLVKTIGDAFLAAFDSPTDAVLCGVEIQQVLRDFNADKAQPEKIEIRIAINSGEVAIHDDGDIYGDPVNITSRLESIAEAGEVFFTEAVYLAMNKREVPSSEIGYRQFKGIPEKIKVFRVLREVPVGEQPRGEAVQPAPDAGPQPIQPAPAVRSAKGARRLASLLIDVCIVTLAMNMLGLEAYGPRYRAVTKDHYAGEETTVKNIDIGPAGIMIKGGSGETIQVGKEGVSIKDSEGNKKKYRRSETRTFGFGEDERGSRRIPLKMLIWALYCALLMWRFGATPGMMILKLKAVDAASGAPLAADKSFLRAFFSLVSISVGLLGYIWAIWEKDKRTWHDIIAGAKIIDR